MEITVQDAMLRIARELKNDQHYYEVWKANLKGHYVESYSNNSVHQPEGFLFCPTSDNVVNIAEEAAEGFIRSIMHYNK